MGWSYRSFSVALRFIGTVVSTPADPVWVTEAEGLADSGGVGAFICSIGPFESDAEQSVAGPSSEPLSCPTMPTMLNTTETRLQAPGVQSLVWDGEVLVDWVAGGGRYLLDGSAVPRSIYYAYPFDSAVSLAGSTYAAIYCAGQTKALILRDGEVHREVNRSYYQANAYEYPICIFRTSSGREVLAHCPDDYCRLQIEDLTTGEVLTQSDARNPRDYFHSRLLAAPNGQYLVSAGWVWHPMDDVHLYSVEEALNDPCHLDGAGLGIKAWAEESSAAFLPDGRLVVALYGIESDDGESTSQGSTELRVFETSRPQEPTTVSMPGRLGTIVSVGNNHVMALYGHPRLIDLRTGVTVQSWPHIASGSRTSSIFGASAATPAMAFDHVGHRYAFADASGITVLQFNPD